MNYDLKKISKGDIKLELVRRSDERYQDIRDRHYVPNKGTHGQQLHFLIWYKGKIIGIISGASAVYGVKARDEFFNIPPNRDIKQKRFLPAIVNNTVFRLEYHVPNLATCILSKWRKAIADLWKIVYEIPVIGFETFVVEENWRKGSLYKADNWSLVGRTKGSTKEHNEGMNKPFHRIDTVPKLIFVRWVDKPIVPVIDYKPSWRQSTPEEKERARQLQAIRNKLYGLKL